MLKNWIITILVIVPYFLFTTGFIFQLTGATPGSMALALYEADWLICSDSEAQAIYWIDDYLEQDTKIYTDEYGGMMLRYRGMREGMRKTSLSLDTFPSDLALIEQGSYIFLRRWNLAYSEARIVEVTYNVPTTRYIKLENLIESDTSVNKVYNSGQVEVLKATTSEPSSPE